MGLFSKPEVVILKESSDAMAYLEKLESIYPKVSGELKQRVQKEIAITKAGIDGEKNVLFELKHSGMDLVVLHDIYVETEDGLGAQIDFFVIAPKLIYIIECKNLFGNIEIDSNGNFIRTLEYGGKKHKEGIYSPITQNERHLMVLKNCRAENAGFILKIVKRANFDTYYKPLIVLANPKTIINDRYAKKTVKEQVIRADQLINVIKQSENSLNILPSGKKDMLAIAESWLARNIEERKEYFTKFENIIQELTANESLIEVNKIDIEQKKANEVERENRLTDRANQSVSPMEELICPKCQSKLVLRVSKKGEHTGQSFYGCSAFPKCRYIKGS